MMSREAKLAWLAAALDCEGCIAITLTAGSRGRKHPAPFVQIINTSMALLLAAKAILEDEIGVANAPIWERRREKNSTKPCYSLYVAGPNNIVPFLEAVLPYLIIKQDFARDLVALLRMRKTGERWTDEQVGLAKEIKAKHMPGSSEARAVRERRAVPEERSQPILSQAREAPAATAGNPLEGAETSRVSGSDNPGHERPTPEGTSGEEIVQASVKAGDRLAN